MRTAAQRSKALKTSAKGKCPSIIVRRMDMEFGDEIPEFWFAGNPLMTLFLTAFSSAFPEGERQFIHSVRLHQNQIQDAMLQVQIRAFIGQEAHHGKEHDALNDMMRRKGYTVDRIYNRFRKMNRFLQANNSPAHQLASTVCMEHITAMFADYFLRVAPERLEQIDESVRKLWIWHSIEEIEHKAVAFDVYQTTVKRPWLLRLVMVESTFFAILINGRGTLELMRDSGHLTDLRAWWQGLVFFFGRKGLITTSIRPYLDFFRPGFHPWQHDNTATLNRLRQKYLGETPKPSAAMLPASPPKKTR